MIHLLNFSCTEDKPCTLHSMSETFQAILLYKEVLGLLNAET